MYLELKTAWIIQLILSLSLTYFLVDLWPHRPLLCGTVLFSTFMCTRLQFEQYNNCWFCSADEINTWSPTFSSLESSGCAGPLHRYRTGILRVRWFHPKSSNLPTSIVMFSAQRAKCVLPTKKNKKKNNQIRKSKRDSRWTLSLYQQASTWEELLEGNFPKIWQRTRWASQLWLQHIFPFIFFSPRLFKFHNLYGEWIHATVCAICADHFPFKSWWGETEMKGGRDRAPPLPRASYLENVLLLFLLFLSSPPSLSVRLCC